MIRLWKNRKSADTKVILCCADSSSAKDVLRIYENAGWYINEKYCIDEVKGKKVRYYLMVRSERVPELKKNSMKLFITAFTKWMFRMVGFSNKERKKGSMPKELNRLSFEIEHYNGSTYIGFELSIMDDGSVEVLRTSDCSLADIDEDYIFESKNDLFRIQSEKPILEMEYNEIRECYEENQQTKRKIR